MNSSTFAKLRIPVLAVATVVVALGGVHLYGQQLFLNYLVWSIGGLLFSALLLFANWIHRRGVSSFDIFIGALNVLLITFISNAVIRYWNSEHSLVVLMFGSVVPSMLAITLVKMLVPKPSLVVKFVLIGFGGFAVTVALVLTSGPSFVALVVFTAAAVSLLFAWHLKARQTQTGG